MLYIYALKAIQYCNNLLTNWCANTARGKGGPTTVIQANRQVPRRAEEQRDKVSACQWEYKREIQMFPVKKSIDVHRLHRLHYFKSHCSVNCTANLFSWHEHKEEMSIAKQCCGSMTFWIRIRIQIRESMPLTNGSGSGSCCFHANKKTNLKKVFLQITFWRYVYVIFQR